MKPKEIEIAIESKECEERPRHYLGISNLAEPCRRALWYDFRLATKYQPISARQQRLFNRGHLEELVVVNDLAKLPGAKLESIEIGENVRDIFQTVFNHDLPPTKQKSVKFCHGHGSGHSDGLLMFTTKGKRKYLIEVKTSKTTHFNQLSKDRNVKRHKPVHYSQVQCYMRLLGLKDCLYIMINKEDDRRLYIHVPLDKDFADHELNRATKIIFMETPPERISGKDGPNYYRCRPYLCKVENVEKLFCEHREICHFNKRFRKSCRTCKHIELHDKGRWYCRNKKKFVTFEKQLKACKKYKQMDSTR